jgi:transposase
VLEYIKFLSSEMNKALEIAQADAQEQMESDEPSVKIQAVSNLKARRRKLEQHLRQEVKEIKSLIVSLRAVENKAVAEAVNKSLKDFLSDFSKQLDNLVSDFED